MWPLSTVEHHPELQVAVNNGELALSIQTKALVLSLLQVSAVPPHFFELSFTCQCQRDDSLCRGGGLLCTAIALGEE